MSLSVLSTPTLMPALIVLLRKSASGMGLQLTAVDSAALADQLERHAIAVSSQIDALDRAESFIAGFEGDELQEGIVDLLQEVRSAKSSTEAPARRPLDAIAPAASMATRIKMACTHCHSDDVRCDADAVWNIATQKWELNALLDGTTCEVCGEEVELDEVAADADAAVTESAAA